MLRGEIRKQAANRFLPLLTFCNLREPCLFIPLIAGCELRESALGLKARDPLRGRLEVQA